MDFFKNGLHKKISAVLHSQAKRGNEGIQDVIKMPTEPDLCETLCLCVFVAESGKFSAEIFFSFYIQILYKVIGNLQFGEGKWQRECMKNWQREFPHSV